MKRRRFIDEQIVAILKEQQAGGSLPEVITQGSGSVSDLPNLSKSHALHHFSELPVAPSMWMAMPGPGTT